MVWGGMIHGWNDQEQDSQKTGGEAEVRASQRWLGSRREASAMASRRARDGVTTNVPTANYVRRQDPDTRPYGMVRNVSNGTSIDDHPAGPAFYSDSGPLVK